VGLEDEDGADDGNHSRPHSPLDPGDQENRDDETQAQDVPVAVPECIPEDRTGRPRREKRLPVKYDDYVFVLIRAALLLNSGYFFLFGDGDLVKSVVVLVLFCCLVVLMSQRG
jgi:hypothetical protein